MKEKILATMVSLGILVLAGCGMQERAKNAAASNANAGSNQGASKPVFKPVAISPDAAKVDDLVNKAVADQAAWKGKEVVVTGYIGATSGTVGKIGYALTLRNDENSPGIGKSVGCYVKDTALPEGMMGKTVEVKGTVDRMDSDARSKTVYLDPCTLKQ